ncbi:PTS fructose transporter subunit IIC [Ectobacillus funiculus]|uniref:PTS fructose transporter subunit IIC n=1 Tax=Ectobacillus funiculus TaxID=137993 RepID=A0ABV5WB85_9BACI
MKRSGLFEGNSKESIHLSIYQHVMNGVSRTFPFVVCTGVLLAFSYIVRLLIANYAHVPPAGFTEQLISITENGNQAMQFIIPVLSGFIAMSIAGRSGLIVGLVGGFIALISNQGFIGSVLAGFLAGYTITGLRQLSSKLPQIVTTLRPVLLYPLFGVIFTCLIMIYITSGPIQGINNAFMGWLENLGTEHILLLGLLLGGMMAIDMGGPFNKIAFTFGITMLYSGNYAPQAAIMAGGMVPPLGLALATTFFSAKFTEQERRAGRMCYVMGASFITEGAIPFAVKNPICIVPACIIGSAIAGLLAMLFHIGLPAPHGGIFVVPLVIGNPFLYLAAILAGSFVTAIIIGLLKQKPTIE